LSSGYGESDFAAKSGGRIGMKSLSQGKLFIIFLALPSLLGLAGCNPLKGFSLGSGCLLGCQPPPPTPEFLYATSTNHVLAFTIDQSSGALSAPLVATGPNQSTGMVASTTGELFTTGQLYVSDFLNDAVDGFSINSSSGALTEIPSSPFSLGGTPPGAGGLTVFVEGGPYLYATDLNAGTVAGFLYNSANGMLTPVPGSPFPASDTPVQAVQAAPQATGSPLFLYVSNLNDSAGGISAFAINQQNGSLSPIGGSPFPTGAPGSFPGPSAMVVSVHNNFLYVALAGTANANNQIVAFSINPTTGSLTPLPQSPFTTGNDPLQMAYVPITAGSQGFLYTGSVQDGTISAFTADDSTGVLTPVQGSPYSAGSSVGGLAAILTSTENTFLYQSDPQAMAVRAYTINGTTGALTAVSGSPFAAGSAAMLLTVATP
jgi:6-phosphogluconolactonase (cycloisomerase 2 family)